MAGLFNRLKTWIQDEKLTYSDLNNEFNNVISNAELQKMKGHSDNLAQIQAVENPAPGGIASVSTNISGADEIERLRYMIQAMSGKSNWYLSPATNLESIGAALNITTNIFQNAVSGMTSIFNYPVFLTCTGSNAVVTLDATPTVFSCYIDGELVTVSADVNLTLSAGTGSSASLGGSLTQFDGFGTRLSLDASVTGTVGKDYVFKFSEGGNTEYVYGTLVSSTSLFVRQRGYCFGGANAEKLPVDFTTAATVEVLKTHYIFLKSDGTLTSTTNHPFYEGSAPSAAVSGDFWYDMSTGLWKSYNGTTWTTVAMAPIGIAACNSTNCIAVRSYEFKKSYNAINTVSPGLFIDPFAATKLTIRQRYSLESQPNLSCVISVNGVLIRCANAEWDPSTDLAAGETFSVAKHYFAYLDEFGVEKLSEIMPVYRGDDLLGWYHPSRMWRCIGKVWLDSATNLDPLYPPQLYKWTYYLTDLSSHAIGANAGYEMTFAVATKNKYLLPPGNVSSTFSTFTIQVTSTAIQTGGGILFSISNSGLSGGTETGSICNMWKTYRGGDTGTDTIGMLNYIDKVTYTEFWGYPQSGTVSPPFITNLNASQGISITMGATTFMNSTFTSDNRL